MCINPVAIWVFLSRLYSNVVLVNGLWVLNITLQLSKIGSFLMFRISVISKVAYCDPQRFKKCNVRRAKLLLSDAAEWVNVVEWWCYRMSYLSALRSVQHDISRSRYHCRRRTCNLTVISSPRKSSNCPFWSTTRIIRSIMLRVVISK